MNRRVLVIGLDGATWDLMRPWMAEGKLPNLRALCEVGASAPLTSTIHPVTTPAWTSFLTGQQQGKHGIYDHVRRRPDSYKMEITNASMIQSPMLFDYIGQAGGRSISLNVPYTFPPRPIPGDMVSGLFATIVGPEITEPPELYDEISSLVPDYVVHPDFDPHASDPLQDFLTKYLTCIRNRVEVARYLMQKEPWSFSIVVFMATDQIQHAYWHFMSEHGPDDPDVGHLHDAILQVYQAIDAEIPALLEQTDEETLVLAMSDHGAGELHRFVNLNRWLSDEGFLTFKQKRTNLSSLLIKQAATLYKRYLPAPWRFQVRKRLGQNFDRAKSEMESQLFASPMNWGKSKAYSMGACGNIFVNLRGREPEGTVEPGDGYEALCQSIVAKLSTLRDPETNEQLVKEVHRREAIYHGPYLNQAPDLIVEWRDYRYWGRGRYDQNDPPLFQEAKTWDFSGLPLTATHRPEGILIAHGPGVPADLSIDQAKLIDLAPTILAYLGIPVPQAMDGRPLAELFFPDFLDVETDSKELVRDEEGAFSFSESDERKIMERLENLGYL
ncbi:MAG: alkaline phosphatase family protein [Chloroflexota bacterium]